MNQPHSTIKRLERENSLLKKRLAQLEADKKKGEKANEHALTLKLESLLAADSAADNGDIGFTDIISVEKLQILQDKFSIANGVSSIILDVSGKPITRPCNMNEACTLELHSGEKCLQADRLIRGKSAVGRPCMLSEAQAPIYVGGKHVANWKVGMCGFGKIIAPFMKAACADSKQYAEVYAGLKDEIRAHFENVCDLLGIMASKISDVAYENVQLAHELLKQRESETLLAEREGTFRGIFDNSVDGILLVGLDGIVKEWSRGYETLSGIPKEEAIGEYVWNVLARMLPKDRHSEHELDRMYAELYEIVTRREQIAVSRNIINLKTGEERIINALYFPVYMPDSILMGAICRDITDDVAKADRLAERESTFRGIFDNSVDGILLIGLDGIVMEWSRGYETLSGIPKEEAVGEYVWNVLAKVLPKDRHNEQELDRMYAELYEIVTRREQITVSRSIINLKTGEERITNALYFPVYMPDGILMGAICRDITDDVEKEHELAAEKERLKSLGDNFPNGCLFQFTVDAQTGQMKISYLGSTWSDLSGVPKEQVEADGNIAFSQIHPDDWAMYVETVKKSVAEISRFNVELRYYMRTGEMKWIQVSSQPRREGNHFVCDGFLLDITDRKNAELKLEAYRNDLEYMVRERTEDLEAAYEELYATNEEFSVTNDELHAKNEQLQREMAVRKEVMLKLEDSEAIIRNFIKQSFEGIVMLDNEGRVIEWNATQERITGISREDALGKHSWELYKSLMPKGSEKERTKAYRKQVLSLLKSGDRKQSDETEHILRTAARDVRHITMASFQIGLVDKRYLGEIVRDTTERKLVDLELDRYRTQLEKMVASQTRELTESKERLTSLSNNLPGGVIYQIYDKKDHPPKFTYISANFANMFRIAVDDVMNDSSLFFQRLHPDDQVKFAGLFAASEQSSFIDAECRVCLDNDEVKWIHMRSSYHVHDSKTRVWDGFMVDITDRKNAEQELEESRRRQSIFIKVLQIVQSYENIPAAINSALSEVGKHVGASRLFIFEKSADGKTADNTYEWCNEGIASEIEHLQGVPVKYMSGWFDAFAKGEYIRVSDVAELPPAVREKLLLQEVKSILVLPLETNGVNYGFAGFGECLQHREWQPHETDLLISLSQIISSTIRRFWAEKSIQMSRQAMRTVLDNINANIYVANFDTYEVLFANKMIKDQMGEDIEGKKCWKVLQKDMTGPCEFCPNPGLLDGNKQSTGMYRSEFRNSRLERWFECTDVAIKWVDGRLVHMEYATDITDRKDAEEAVRQSEEMYRQLTVASPDAIVVCDPKGKIIYISPRARELFHIGDSTDVSNLRMSRYVHPHDLRKSVEMFRSFVEDRVTFVPQLLLMHEDGSGFFGEVSAASVKDDTGRTTSVITVIRDITERRMSEMELIRAKEKAEESDNLKSAFLANMSHEIRTPINGIIGFLNFLADDNLSPVRRHEYITVVNNSSVQLVKLIDDIIDVAKIEARQMSIRPTIVRLNEFMREVHVFFETYLQSNNKNRIALLLDDSGFIDPCATFVDPVRLRQVLTNLISNAIKFTEKGFIGFGYRLLPPDKLEFWVEDSGIGLALDQQEIIFERFRQAELAGNRRYGGTGLGLTISRSLVQMMGGDITVESIEGEGSTFRFTISYLPVGPEDEPLFDETATEKANTDRPLEGMAVLLVEPEIMTYKYYEQILMSTGVTLIQAQTAKQWMDTISQWKHINAVLADARVFENENREALRQVKSVRAGLPLVLAVPERNEYYNGLICDSQCNKVIEGTVNYTKLCDVLKKYR